LNANKLSVSFRFGSTDCSYRRFYASLVHEKTGGDSAPATGYIGLNKNRLHFTRVVFFSSR
jgi:hypothetical protein